MISPVVLVLLSIGFTLVHVATVPPHDVNYYLSDNAGFSLEEITFIIVYFTQTICAPLVTIAIRKCCSKTNVLLFGVMLCGSWFITISFHLHPAIHIALGVCLGIANAIINTALLHIIAGKNPALPGTKSFSIWSATLGFSYAVAGAQKFFVPDEVLNSGANLTTTNTTNIESILDGHLGTVQIVTPLVIYLIGAGLLIGSAVTNSCSSEPGTSVELVPRAGSIRWRAWIALALMILFYGFMGSILVELFTVCSASIGYQASSITSFGVAFAVLSLYVTYKGKSELNTSAILATLLVFGFILTGVLFPTGCIAEDGFYMIGSAPMLIPIAGMFLGGGSGLLTCEVLSFVSMGMNTDFRYAALVASQGFWSALSTFIPSLAHPRNFLIIMTVLAVIYYFLAFYVHVVLTRYLKNVARERSRRIYGSVYSVSDSKPEGTYRETTRVIKPSKKVVKFELPPQTC